MLEQNGNINWFPEHFKHGRFAKTMNQAPRLEPQPRPLLGDRYAGLER
jgi:hypothetical protein